jgi:hypothetical protein
VASLTVADIQRWSAESVRDVFHAGQARAQSTFSVSRELSTLRVFDTWEGEAAKAAHHSIALTRQDLDAHGREVLAVARAAETAADGIERVQQGLRQLEVDAEAHGLEIDPGSNRIVPIPHSRHGRREMQAAIPGLQGRLDGLITEANTIDAALATAIDMADGDMPLPASAPSPQGSNPIAAPGNQQIKGISASQAALEQLQRGLGPDQISAAASGTSFSDLKPKDFVPSPEDWAWNGVGAAVGAKTDIPGYFVEKAMKDVAKGEPGHWVKTAFTESSWKTLKIRPASGLLAAPFLAWNIERDMEEPDVSGYQAVAKEGGGFLASAGAAALAGTMIAGPAGTVVGLIGGMFVGAVASKGIDALWEPGANAVGKVLSVFGGGG